jgi:ComF family protein
VRIDAVGAVNALLEHGAPLVSAGSYHGPLGDAVRKLKYQGRTDLAAPLAERLAASLRPLKAHEGATFVPVPLHPKRLADRGYNQSALVARKLGQILGAPVEPRALVRLRVTGEQAALARAERLLNLRGAFALRYPGTLSNVVLVDDVVTTGATALACARAVEAGGGRVVAVAALARAEGGQNEADEADEAERARQDRSVDRRGAHPKTQKN